MAFDQPAAGGTADPFDQQAGFGQLTLMAYKWLLYFSAIVECQFVSQFARQGFGVAGGFTTMLVIAFKATLDDGFGNGLAARTAKVSRLLQYAGLEAAAGRNRQAAVVAG